MRAPEFLSALPNGARALVLSDQKLEQQKFSARIVALEQQIAEHAAAALVTGTLSDGGQRRHQLRIVCLHGEPASGTSQATLPTLLTTQTRPSLQGTPSQG